ncbi:MAG: nuclear transport factor 2 family protein [Vicinamibacterales bacterium]
MRRATLLRVGVVVLGAWVLACAAPPASAPEAEVAQAPAQAPAPAPDEAGVATAVEAFYGAMKAGDAAAAMALIAPDAVFLESGGLETRAEYEANHLPADIGFESQVNGTRGPLRITFEGDAAWVIATTDYDGTFEGRPVAFTSAQLMVLTRDDGPWRIRTIHWSSRQRR